MSHSADREQMITGFVASTVDATSALYEKDLYGQLLVVIYSAIDTLGLLDAPPSQTSATGESFKNWVKKYILPQPGIEFNEVDLWGARCAVLHTFTSQSDLSKAGKARELQYYGGDKKSAQAVQFVKLVRGMNGGVYLPVHFEDLYMAVLEGLRKFVYDLDAKCSADPAIENRLRNVLQVFPMPNAL